MRASSRRELRTPTARRGRFAGGAPALALALALAVGPQAADSTHAAAPAAPAPTPPSPRPTAQVKRTALDAQYTTLLRTASRQTQQGQHAAALETYRQMLALYPDDPIATRGMSDVLIALARTGEAEALLRETLARKGHDDGLRQSLAEVHKSQGKFELYLEDVSRLLTEGPKDAPLPLAWAQRALEHLAGEASTSGKVEPAIRKMIAERKDRPELRLLLAEAMIRKGQVEPAYLEVTEADRASGSGGNLLFQFADGLYSEGLSEMAGNAYRRAGEMAADKELKRRSWRRAAEVAEEGERWSEAVLAYQGLASVDPRSTEGVEALLTVADIQQSRLRNYEAALASYRALESNLPSERLGRLYLQMADCYLRMNRPTESQTWLGKVKGTKADAEVQAEAAFLQAEILFFSGDFKGAQTAYEDLARNFTRTRKTNDAVGRYLQIVKFKDLKQTEALKAYARMEEANRMGDTTAVVETSHRLQADYAATDLAADALVREAEVVRMRGNGESAVALCLKAVSEHPKARIAPYALSLMGHILLNNLNDRNRALEAWEQLLGDYPDNMLAAQIRRTVERLRRNNES